MIRTYGHLSLNLKIIKDDFIPCSGFLFSVLVHPYRAGNPVYSTPTGMLAPSMDKPKEDQPERKKDESPGKKDKRSIRPGSI